MASNGKIFVEHYGPLYTEDPDHSTYIQITYENAPMESMVIHNDQDARELIRLLQQALNEADGPAGYACQECGAWGTVEVHLYTCSHYKAMNHNH